MIPASGPAGFVAGRLGATHLPWADTQRSIAGDIDLRTWGDPVRVGDGVVLTAVRRRRGGQVGAAEIDRLARDDPAALSGLLPPFAVAAALPDGLRLIGDFMGFRHLYLTRQPSDPAAVSSSALALADAVQAPLDHEAVAVQSLLGWQLADRTMFKGVRKLPAGAVADLRATGIELRDGPAPDDTPIDFADAVTAAARVLRESLAALLDDHPEAVLQLTGGMDSRLLLSAIPAPRRKGLRAMTLAVPGSGDVAIASLVAQRYGIRHDVHGLTDLGALDREEAHRLCLDAALRLDAMADPVALAAQSIAERTFDQGVRISGLGGEIARGFYYLGRVVDRGFDRSDAVRLADWRMFANESVEPGLLVADFASWARHTAHDAVYAALRSGGDEWLRATDRLYLGHRMQRWAGATDVAVSAQRTVINPMLDPEFVAIAGRLRPNQKRAGRFLAAVQMELDPELGRVPLDGRPAPAFFAAPPVHAPVVQALVVGRKAGRKVIQRARRGNRAPAGGDVLAARVVQHWRAEPSVLDPIAELDFIDGRWLRDVLDGHTEPRPSSVAFVTNLLAATS